MRSCPCLLSFLCGIFNACEELDFPPTSSAGSNPYRSGANISLFVVQLYGQQSSCVYWDLLWQKVTEIGLGGCICWVPLFYSHVQLRFTVSCSLWPLDFTCFLKHLSSHTDFPPFLKIFWVVVGYSFPVCWNFTVVFFFFLHQFDS